MPNMDSNSTHIERLLVRARSGEEEAINDLLQQYRDDLRRIAECELHGPVIARIDASDVVQETLLEGFRDFRQFRGNCGPEFEAWLRAILGHRLQAATRREMAEKRSPKREQRDQSEDKSPLIDQFPADQTSPSEAAMRAERQRLADRAVSNLSDRERQAFNLRYRNELSLEDIAREMECTYQAVAGLLARALRKLRDELGDSSME